MERNIVRPNAGSKSFDTNIEEIRQAEQINKELSNIQQDFIKKFSVGEIISADELQKLQDVLQKFKELSAVSTDARIHFIEMVGEFSNTVATIARDLQDSNHFDTYTQDLTECINIVKRLGENQLSFHSNSNETSKQLQNLITLFNKLQQNAINDISLDSTSADHIFDKKEELINSFSKIKEAANKAELTNNALQEFHNILQNTLKDNDLLVGKLHNDIQNTNRTINKSTTDLLAASKAFKTDVIPSSFDTLHSGLQDIQIASNEINEQLITSGTVDKNILEQFNEGIKQATTGQIEVQRTINESLDDLNRPFIEHIANSSMNALNAISQAEKVYKDAIDLSDKLNNDLHYDAIQMLRDSKQQMEVAQTEILNTMRTQAAENIEVFFNVVTESIKAGKSDLYTESATGYNLGTNYLNAANLAGQASVDIYQKSIQLQSMAGILNRRRLQQIQEKAQELAKVQEVISRSETNAMRSFDAMNKAQSPDEKRKLKAQAELQFNKAIENQMIANTISQELGRHMDELTVNGLNDFGKDGKAIVTSIENVLNQNQAATRNLLSAASNYHLEVDENSLGNLKKQYKSLGERAVKLHETNLKFTDFSKYFSSARTTTIRGFKTMMRSITTTLSNLGIQSFTLNIFDYIFKPLKYISDQGKERYKTMGIDAAVGVTDMGTSAALTQQRLMEGNQLYAESGGMIDRGFINDMYKDLMKNVGGHYGSSPEQARDDVNKFVHQTYKIAAANGLDNKTMEDIFQTYYKDMKLSSEEAAGEFAKMMDTAKKANVPIKNYMNMMNNLAKSFMKVGIKGTKADEVMQKLLMDGLRADVALEVTQQAAGALSKNAQDKNWIAYAASVSGMNPFEGIARAAYSHEADGSERAGWADDMAKMADIRIKTIAGAAGNDPNIKRMLVTDEFKNMGFQQREASILTSSYLSGNTEQFKRLFSEKSAEKDDPRAKLDKANEEAEKALTAMAGQLAESDRLGAKLDAAMYAYADKLSSAVNDLIKQLAPLLKKLQQAMMIIAVSLLKAFKEFTESDTLRKIGKFLIETPIKAIAALLGFTALEVIMTKKASTSAKIAEKALKVGAAGMILDDAFSDKKPEKNKDDRPSALDILIKGFDDTQKVFTGESLNKPVKDENDNVVKDKDGKIVKKQSDPLVNILSSMGQTVKRAAGLREGKTVQEAIEDTPSTGISESSFETPDIESTISSLGSTSSSSHSTSVSSSLNVSSTTSSKLSGKSSSKSSSSSSNIGTTLVSSSLTSDKEKISSSQSIIQSKKPVPAALKLDAHSTYKMQGTPSKAKVKKEQNKFVPKDKTENEMSNIYRDIYKDNFKNPLNVPLMTTNVEGKPMSMENTTLERDYQEIEMRRLGQVGMDKSAILANIRSDSNINTEEILVKYNYPTNKAISGQPSQEKFYTPYANIAAVDKYDSLNDYYKSFTVESISQSSENIGNKFTEDINKIKNDALKEIKNISMTKGEIESKQFEKDEKEKFVKEQYAMKSDTSRKDAMNSHAKKVVTQAKKNEDLSKVRNKNITEFMKLMQQLWGNFQASVSTEHSNLWKKLNEVEEVLKIINENWIKYGKALGSVNFGSISGVMPNTGDLLDDLAVYASSIAKARGHNIPVEFFRTILRSEAGSSLNSYQSTHWNNPLGMDWSSWHAKFGGKPAGELSSHGHTRTIFPSKEKAMEALVEYFLADDAHKWAKEEIALIEQGKWEEAFRIHYKYYVGNGGAYEGSVYSQIVKEEFGSGKVRYGGNVNHGGGGGSFSSSNASGNAGSPSGTLNGIPLYRMWDPRWGNKPYEYASGGSNTMTMSGCGPTAFAMLASYHGRTMDPYQAAQIMKHMHVQGGTSLGGWEELAQRYGFKLRKTSSKQDVINALKQGKKILAAHGTGMFAGGGHYIIYAGMTADGKVLVADPNQEGKRNNRGDNYGYDINTLLSDGGVSDWWIDETSGGGVSYSSGGFSGGRVTYNANYLSADGVSANYQDKSQYMINQNGIGNQQIKTAEQLQKEAEAKMQQIANAQVKEIEGLSKEEQIKKLYTMKGPNQKTYSKNDVDYLIKQGYNAADIIKELSQSDTYKIKPKMPIQQSTGPNILELYRYKDAFDITTQNNQVIVHSLTEQPYGVNTDTLYADTAEVILADGRRVSGAYLNSLLRQRTRIGDPFLEEFLKKQTKIDNEEVVEEGLKTYYRRVQLRINVKNGKEIFLKKTGTKLEKKFEELQKKYEFIGERFISLETVEIADKFKQVQAITKKMKKE